MEYFMKNNRVFTYHIKFGGGDNSLIIIILTNY